MKKIIIGMLFCASLLLAQGSGTLPMTAAPPTGPLQVYVTNVGATGGTSYCYWVLAVFNSGMSAPGGPACTGTANVTLDSSNYNAVSWNMPPGGSPIGYWVVRSTGSSFPGSGTDAVNSTVISSSTYVKNDQSNTLNAFTLAPAGYANYSFVLNNIGFSLPVVQIQDAQGNVQYQWYMNGNIHHKIESVEGNVTVAALHAVPVVVVPVLGATLRVVGVLLQAVGGSAATCTAVNITDTAGTPIVAVSVAASALTSGTVVNEATASGVTLTTFLTNLTTSKGLELSDTGGQCTTATSFNYRIFYKVLP